jgi:anti-sigma factor RsiW
MTRAACATVLPQQWLGYWLGELEGADEARLDEHLFACAACTERLQAIVELGAAIRAELARGALNIVLPEPFLRRVQAAGLRVREYALSPGGSVDCTIAPGDDLVVAHLRAPLRGVRRLDVLIDSSVAGKLRANDVPFDADADALVAVTSSVFLRTLRHAQQRVQLVAVDGAGERVLADYTFNHYPTP